jgi:invasion protein IalB
MIAVDFLKRVNESEDSVKRYSYAIFFCFGLMISMAGAAFAQQPPAQQLPANVAGKWTLYCKDPNGTTSAKDRTSPAASKARSMNNTSWFERRPGTC